MMVGPYSIDVDTNSIPEVFEGSACVRAAAGDVADMKSPAVFPQPFSLHDSLLHGQQSLMFPCRRHRGVGCYIVHGWAMITVDGRVS